MKITHRMERTIVDLSFMDGWDSDLKPEKRPPCPECGSRPTSKSIQWVCPDCGKTWQKNYRRKRG